MAFQYGAAGGFGRAIDQMMDMAAHPGGRGFGSYSREQVNQYNALQSAMPYLAQIEQVRAQQRAAEEADRRRYRYQYGI